MITQRQLFLQHVAQTSPFPMMLEIVSAKGIYLYDIYGKKYIDLISGIGVSNVGHCHPEVVEAIRVQSEQYMHLMVYGEYIQSPQLRLAHTLSQMLPSSLNCSYFVNSGSEAIEGAMKLAKRVTGRTEIISFKSAYHGSTQGSLSIMGDEHLKNAYRPLLPDTKIIDFNNLQSLELITHRTACIFVEMIQGEAGAVCPDEYFIKALRKKCTETGTLLISDEIQTGFGRTGKMFAFEHFGIVPDIITVAKGMGGGMPTAAFISSTEIMSALTYEPMLGHLTTFGGHPVCCAAALACIGIIQREGLVDKSKMNENIFRELLFHPLIKKISGKGLLLAVEFGSAEINFSVISKCIQNGLITDWFLFANHKMRIAPPLNITEEEIKYSCDIILKCINETAAEFNF